MNHSERHINSLIGSKIKELRQDREMTQEDLADKLGMKRASSIAKIENGAQKPSIHMILQMMIMFSVSLSTLLPFDDFINDKKVSERPGVAKFLETANAHLGV